MRSTRVGGLQLTVTENGPAAWGWMNSLVDDVEPAEPVKVWVACVEQAAVEVEVEVEVVVVVVVEAQLHGYGWQALASPLSGRYWQCELGEPVLWSSASESPSHW